MSSIVIKTPEEIELMRESGRLLASVFAMLDDFIKPGVSTLAINDKVEDYIVNTLQSRPASKGQYGFQYVLNTSLNEVVCHGVPKADELVKDKDIINVDITCSAARNSALSGAKFCTARNGEISAFCTVQN